jgi:hypothetical protein
MPEVPLDPPLPPQLPQSGPGPPHLGGPGGSASPAPVEFSSAEPLASFEVPAAPGPVKVTVACEPKSGGILIRVAGTSVQAGTWTQTEACDPRTALGEILRQIRAVAQGTFELRRENRQLEEENERLRGMQAHGLFDFVLKVERDDFLAFAVIMALGSRNAARKFLDAPKRTFYDRLERWKAGDQNHRDMLRWIAWRKTVGRKIKLRLPQTPEALHEVVAAIGESSSRDYPSLLRQILEVLLAVNPKNCNRICSELVVLIKEELPQ